MKRIISIAVAVCLALSFAVSAAEPSKEQEIRWLIAQKLEFEIGARSNDKFNYICDHAEQLVDKYKLDIEEFIELLEAADASSLNKFGDFIAESAWYNSCAISDPDALLAAAASGAIEEYLTAWNAVFTPIAVGVFGEEFVESIEGKIRTEKVDRTMGTLAYSSISVFFPGSKTEYIKGHNAKTYAADADNYYAELYGKAITDYVNSFFGAEYIKEKFNLETDFIYDFSESADLIINELTAELSPEQQTEFDEGTLDLEQNFELNILPGAYFKVARDNYTDEYFAYCIARFKNIMLSYDLYAQFMFLYTGNDSAGFAETYYELLYENSFYNPVATTETLDESSAGILDFMKNSINSSILSEYYSYSLLDLFGIKGDINNDGFVTAEDALIALKSITTNTKLSRFSTALGDYNADREISVTEVLKILKTAIQQ